MPDHGVLHRPPGQDGPLAAGVGARVRDPASLYDAPLSPHSHIISTRNANQPEWWNVVVVGVTSRTAYHQIVSAHDKYREIQRLRARHDPAVTGNIPTNVDLWFQTLPGSVGTH